MFADITPVAENTLMIEGKIPRNILFEPDVANALLYRHGENLYILDTGATLFFKRRMKEAVDQLGPFKNLFLFNSHSHPDHTANNSIIDDISAENKHHFLSGKGILDLNYGPAIIKNYKETSPPFSLP